MSTEKPALTMKIVKGPPPNLDEIAAVLPWARRPAVMFTYGDAIYVPSGQQVPAALLEHERVHAERQLAFEGGPEAWWRRYLAEPAFRLQEEYLAHRVEYEWWERNGSRPARRRARVVIGDRLCSPLYGKCCTKAQARALITGKLDFYAGGWVGDRLDLEPGFHGIKR